MSDPAADTAFVALVPRAAQHRAWLTWLALASLALAASATIVMVLAGYGYRFGWWGLGSAFAILRSVAYLGAAIAGLSLLVAIACVLLGRRRLALAPLLGVALAAIAFALPYSLQMRGSSVPAIHDITTDFADPPRFVLLKSLREGTPNGETYGGSIVADQQRRAYGDIGPVMLKLTSDQAMARVLSIAQDMGWDIAGVAEMLLEATATTPWFGFKDDIVVRVRPATIDGVAGSRIDIRSVSRIGKSDLGTNARRVRETIERLQR